MTVEKGSNPMPAAPLLFFSFLLCILFLTGCQKEKENGEKTEYENSVIIKKEDRHIIFLTQYFPPYSYLEDGEVSGPAADIIKEVCREGGIPYSVKLLPWPRAQKEIDEGHANGLFVIGRNTERIERLYFSPAVFAAEYGLFLNKESDLQYSDIHDLEGWIVGVYGPSNTSNSLEQIHKEVNSSFIIDMSAGQEAAFLKLSAGRINAVYANMDVGMFLIEDLELENIYFAGLHRKLYYYFGFSKEYTDKTIVDRFNSTYLKLYHNGTIFRLLRGYNMVPAQPFLKNPNKAGPKPAPKPGP